MTLIPLTGESWGRNKGHEQIYIVVAFSDHSQVTPFSSTEKKKSIVLIPGSYFQGSLRIESSIISLPQGEEQQNLLKGDKPTTGKGFGDPHGSPHLPSPCRLRQ